MLIQGDQYRIYDRITENDNPLDITKVSKIEFALGANITKYYPKDVSYDTVEKMFAIPLTQADTYELQDKFDYQIAVQFIDGTVYHTPKQIYKVGNAVTRTVFANG